MITPSLRTLPVRVAMIDRDHDRFGRLYPEVIVESLLPDQAERSLTVPLPNYQQLVEQDYRPEDIVELQLYGRHRRLGRVLEPQGDHRMPWTLETILSHDTCRACQRPLSLRDGVPYCPEENCPSTVAARCLHAVQPHVLDLPLTAPLIDYLVWGDELVQTVVDLFCLDPKEIQWLPWYAKDEVAAICETVQERRRQLQGELGSPALQLYHQQRCLDALSLTGLYGTNLKTLCHGLQTGSWHWGDLPAVLLDRRSLVQSGITPRAAQKITEAATARVPELDTLVREF